MGEQGAHIRLKLDTDEPVALGNFVGSFVGLGNQFDKFVTREHPGVKLASEFFVQEVRAGCVQADLVAILMPLVATQALPGIIDAIDKAQVLQKFVTDFGNRLRNYFVPGGRDLSATRTDLADFHKAVGTIAADPNAIGRLEVAEYIDGERKIRCKFQFTAQEAREAQQQLADHRKEMDGTKGSDFERVLLRFVRPSVESGKPGRKTGERGIIDRIHTKALPILYASELAEQRLRSELFAVEVNVFRMFFDVDVNVETNSSERPMAYRIVQVHAVIEPSEDDPELEA